MAGIWESVFLLSLSWTFKLRCYLLISSTVFFRSSTFFFSSSFAFSFYFSIVVYFYSKSWLWFFPLYFFSSYTLPNWSLNLPFSSFIRVTISFLSCSVLASCYFSRPLSSLSLPFSFYSWTIFYLSSLTSSRLVLSGPDSSWSEFYCLFRKALRAATSWANSGALKLGVTLFFSEIAKSSLFNCSFSSIRYAI